MKAKYTVREAELLHTLSGLRKSTIQMHYDAFLLITNVQSGYLSSCSLFKYISIYKQLAKFMLTLNSCYNAITT